jgi:hypothetical protein
MIAGLIGVFVFLPKWQERREVSVTTGHTGPTVERPAATPTGPTANPAATSPAIEPSPAPTATHTPPPVSVPSESALPSPPVSREERGYVEAMSEGLEALERGQWQLAQAAFERASRLRPGAPEVADGLARVRAGQRRESVAVDLQKAGELEQKEAWREAEKLYGAVLAMDPESAAALAGYKRTQTRADLDEKLEFHIDNPGRLSTAAVFDDASSILEEAVDTTPSGPRLESQISSLEAALERASTPVAVVLESDSLTDVVVYRVGRLGSFTRRELNLKPGAYTVVGSRSGFRDVRLQLVVTPGTPPKPLVIQCTERL